MTEFEEYNYCLIQINALTEKLRNMGFMYDEHYGWYNYYNRPISKKQQEEIDVIKIKIQKYTEYSGKIRKKLGL